MTISAIISALEKMAPMFLQESYDNSGLITGQKQTECTGALLCLDVTESVINDAITKNCNLIISHHPIVFKGIKKFDSDYYVDKTIITAIKNDIAIYACHTNMDNVINGVNGKIADKLNLINRKILQPKPFLIQKLVVFVPLEHQEAIEKSLFDAGAGKMGNYGDCSFVSEGTGSFKPLEGADPHTGSIGIRTIQKEAKVEVIFPIWNQSAILNAMKNAHPYEQVAYELYTLQNKHQEIGAGIIAELEQLVDIKDFLNELKSIFNVKCLKHTQIISDNIKKIAICGGSGSFLIQDAIRAKADVLITSDIKYHDFFEANNQLVLVDIGHFESEQFTIELFADVLKNNFPTFAHFKTDVHTNPVKYL
jgi:dinuclear metal center YbgI/SA1388 family protein